MTSWEKPRRGRHRQMLPVPLMDAVECWIPTEEQVLEAKIPGEENRKGKARQAEDLWGGARGEIHHNHRGGIRRSKDGGSKASAQVQPSDRAGRGDSPGASAFVVPTSPSTRSPQTRISLNKATAANLQEQLLGAPLQLETSQQDDSSPTEQIKSCLKKDSPRLLSPRVSIELPAKEVEAPLEAPPVQEQLSKSSNHEREDAIVAELDDLLQQHRRELGIFIDSRLTEHHDSLLRTFSEQTSQGGKRGFFQGLFRSESGGQCPSGQGQSERREPEREQRTPRYSGMEPHPSSEGHADLRKMDFEQHEKQKMNRSRKATRASTANPHSTSSSNMPFNGGRKVLRRGMESTCMETFVSILIIANVCFLGVEVQCTRMMRDDEIPSGFKMAAMGFTIFFSSELVLRFVAWGPREFVCGEHRNWNLVDSFLVFTSVLEIVMDIIMEFTPKLDYIRIVRMIRASRILRLVRIMKFFRPLRILVMSIMNTLRSLFWTLILLGMIIYLFAVLFTLASTEVLVKNYHAAMAQPTPVEEALHDHFGSLWSSINSLFKAITGGTDWEQCFDSLQPLNPLWSALFLAYIAVSHFAILNVVTGVVCQTAIESARQDQDIVVQAQLSVKQHYVKQFQDLFKQFDSDRSGQITLAEFEDRLAESSVQDYFSAMDLTIDEAWNLFKLLDNHETCAIDVEEFVAGCLRLRGTARSIDVHMLMYQSKWTMKKLAILMAEIEDLQEMLHGPGRPHKLTNGDIHGDIMVQCSSRSRPETQQMDEL